MLRPALICLLFITCAACSSESDSLDDSAADASSSDAAADSNVAADTGQQEDDATRSDDDAGGFELPESWEPSAEDFDCLTNWTAVRGFYVTNALGLESETTRIAEEGFVEPLPPGTIIQLVPQEAMVKLLPGTLPETNDWEYFNLTASAEGTTIRERGGAEVSNPAGSCFGCHAGAAERDFICEDTGLCADAAVPRNIVDVLVESDARCQ